MDLSPITKIAIETKINASKKRLRIAWKERENAIGYNLYISFSSNSPKKINTTLIEQNFTDIILPETPRREIYVWVIGVDEDNKTTEFKSKPNHWKLRNLEETTIMSYFDFDNDDNYFENISQIHWPKAGSPIFNEEPAGDKNGDNTEFSVRFDYRTDSIRIYKNGIRLMPTEYEELNGNEFSLEAAPISDDDLLCDYIIE